MSIQIELFRCTAESNRINKNAFMYGSWICEGNIKEDTSIIKPSILIEKNTPPQNNKYNYMKISAFNRYYFIDNIVCVNNNRWLIEARCDVLQTYKTDIFNTKCILDKTEEPSKANMYYNDGSFILDSRKYNNVLKFPSGLPEQGYNILICAGGL